MVLGERRQIATQLGYVLEGVGPQIVLEDSGTSTVWIHNDNALNLGVGTMNHYQAIEIYLGDDL